MPVVAASPYLRCCYLCCYWCATNGPPARAVCLPGVLNHVTVPKYAKIIITSRDRPPFGELPLLWRIVNDIPRRHCDDDPSTITILLNIIMLGQCMLLVIASDMVNRMPILGLMECIASDHAEYRSRKKGHANRAVARVYVTVNYCAIANPEIGGPQFRNRAVFLLPGCNAFHYIAYNTYGRIHETATIAKRPSQHCPRRSSLTTVCFVNSVISP